MAGVGSLISWWNLRNTKNQDSLLHGDPASAIRLRPGTGPSPHPHSHQQDLEATNVTLLGHDFIFLDSVFQAGT